MIIPIAELWQHMTLGDKLELIKLLKDEGLL